MKRRIWKHNVELLEKLCENHNISTSISPAFKDADGDELCEVTVHHPDADVLTQMWKEYDSKRVHRSSTE